MSRSIHLDNVLSCRALTGQAKLREFRLKRFTSNEGHDLAACHESKSQILMVEGELQALDIDEP